MMSFVYPLFLTYIVINGAAGAEGQSAAVRHKRQLPLNIHCDVQSTAESRRCYKGDLIDVSIADCKKTQTFFSWMCDPINEDTFSTSVDVPDMSVHGVDCLLVNGKPVRCGDLDTRCVCDAPVDVTSELQRPYIANRKLDVEYEN